MNINKRIWHTEIVSLAYNAGRTINDGINDFQKIQINNRWWYYCFVDISDNGRITMKGQIPERKLKELIEELKDNQK